VNVSMVAVARRVVAATAVLVATAGGLAAPAAAAPSRVQYKFTRLAKAKPDECLNGLGQAYPAGPPCASGQAKVNQAYVWGLTQAGPTIWFGTGANVHCLVGGDTLGNLKPVANSDWTCEYGES